MSIAGRCNCNNIQINWHTSGDGLVPRACQCAYCLPKAAAYVTQSGTCFEAFIRNERLHKEVRHGSKNAVFHECVNCSQVVFVTTEIDGVFHGALNAKHLYTPFGFSDPVKLNFSDQTEEQKRERWRESWCYPVLIISEGIRRDMSTPMP